MEAEADAQTKGKGKARASATPGKDKGGGTPKKNTPATAVPDKVKLTAEEVIKYLKAGVLIFGIAADKRNDVTVLFNPDSKDQIRTDMATLDMIAYAISPTHVYREGSFTLQLLSYFEGVSPKILETSMADLVKYADGVADQQKQFTITKKIFQDRFAVPCLLLASGRATPAHAAFVTLCEKVLLDTMTAIGTKEYFNDVPSEMSKNRKNLLDARRQIEEIGPGTAVIEGAPKVALLAMLKSFPQLSTLWGDKERKVITFQRIMAYASKRPILTEQAIATELGIPVDDSKPNPIQDYIQDHLDGMGEVRYLRARTQNSTKTAATLEQQDIFPCVTTVGLKFVSLFMESKQALMMNAEGKSVTNDETVKNLVFECYRFLIVRINNPRPPVVRRTVDNVNQGIEDETQHVTVEDFTGLCKKFMEQWASTIEGFFTDTDTFPYTEYGIKTTFRKYLTLTVEKAKPQPDQSANDVIGAYSANFTDEIDEALEDKTMFDASMYVEDYLHILFCKLHENCKNISMPGAENGLEYIRFLNLQHPGAVAITKNAIIEGLDPDLKKILTSFKPADLLDCLAEDILFIWIEANRPKWSKTEYSMQDHFDQRFKSPEKRVRHSLLKIAHISLAAKAIDVDVLAADQTGTGLAPAMPAAEQIEAGPAPAAEPIEAGPAPAMPVADQLGVGSAPAVEEIEAGPAPIPDTNADHEIDHAADVLVGLRVQVSTHGTAVLTKLAGLILSGYPEFEGAHYNMVVKKPSVEKMVEALQKIYTNTSLDLVDFEFLHADAISMVCKIHTDANPSYVLDNGYDKLDLTGLSAGDISTIIIANTVKIAVARNKCPAVYSLNNLKNLKRKPDSTTDLDPEDPKAQKTAA